MLLNVLVVDDDDYTLNRHYNGIMQLANLYNVGVEITKFSCAEGELRQHIKEKNIDFVLLDIEIGKKKWVICRTFDSKVSSILIFSIRDETRTVHRTSK